MNTEQITPPTKPVTLTPEHFGRARHGVHIFEHEDDWGWTAFGHPEPRRLIAAINHICRDHGITEDLRSFTDPDGIQKGIQRRWACNVRAECVDHDTALPDENIYWDWCEADARGAVPVTVVLP